MDEPHSYGETQESTLQGQEGLLPDPQQFWTHLHDLFRKKEPEGVDLILCVQKTNTEPPLQTEGLSQQQAMQKAEEVHPFPRFRT